MVAHDDNKKEKMIFSLFYFCLLFIQFYYLFPIVNAHP